MDSQDETSRTRARRLLALVRERTEHSHEPVFVTELAAACQLSKEESEAAWRYLRDYGFIHTFSIPYTARINARGIDVLDSASKGHSGGGALAAQPTAAGEPTNEKSESTADRWIRSLKNNRVIAAIVVVAVTIIGIGAVAEAIKHIRESITPGTEQHGQFSAVAERDRVPEASPHRPTPASEPSQVASKSPPKACSGEKTLTFSPSDPGVMQTGPDGRRVDLGDGGGGTRLEEWKTRWTAPAKVTSVTCSGQRNEHVLAQNKDGSNAECVGSINGGNDAISMHVAWDGPCDQP